MQHADGDAGWRLGRHDSGLNLDTKTQTHLRASRGAIRRVSVSAGVRGRASAASSASWFARSVVPCSEVDRVTFTIY